MKKRGRKKLKQKLNKIVKKTKRNVFVVIVFIIGLVLFGLLASLIYLIKTQPVIYISSLTPRQGETILIKVSGNRPELSGYFDQQKLVFFKTSNSSSKISLLGIDADLTPGKHQIVLNLSPTEKEAREIDVQPSNYRSANISGNSKLNSKGYTKQVIFDNVVNNDNPVLSKIMENSNPQAYFSQPFTYPLSNIQTSGFEFGIFVGAVGYMQHFGVDLAAKKDTEVFAINDGRVVLAENLSNYGKTIIIDHGLGIFSLYLHLDNFDVSVDQLVKNGQKIGLSGDTGASTGPHLHFSIRNSGSRVDPLLFIQTASSI
jgi:murein DD-endopeptidase MepM/ murein hydrolase activator NlpD